MKLIKTTQWIAVVAALTCSTAALADEVYTCTHGDQQRVISLVYMNAGQPVPCQVTYDKGAGSLVLWSAENQAGYCEEQLAAFIEKQRVWGWNCKAEQLEQEQPQQEQQQEQAPE